MELISQQLSGFDQASAEGACNVAYDEQVSYNSHPDSKPGKYTINTRLYLLHY